MQSVAKNTTQSDNGAADGPKSGKIHMASPARSQVVEDLREKIGEMRYQVGWLAKNTLEAFGGSLNADEADVHHSVVMMVALVQDLESIAGTIEYAMTRNADKKEVASAPKAPAVDWPELVRGWIGWMEDDAESLDSWFVEHTDEIASEHAPSIRSNMRHIIAVMRNELAKAGGAA